MCFSIEQILAIEEMDAELEVMRNENKNRVIS